MAKRGGVNKTKAVLEYLRAHRDATNKEVSEALAQQGIDIKPTHVSTIKTQHKKKRRAVKAVGKKRGVGIPEIKAALGLLKVCGTTEAVNEALAAAQEIREMV